MCWFIPVPFKVKPVEEEDSAQFFRYIRVAIYSLISRSLSTPRHAASKAASSAPTQASTASSADPANTQDTQDAHVPAAVSLAEQFGRKEGSAGFSFGF